MTTIGAVFDSDEEARDAYRRLQDAGIAGDAIGIVMRDETAQEQRQENRSHNEAPLAGAALGAVVGGSTGWTFALLGAALVSIPVVGPVILAGAAAGAAAAAGGGLGWLVGGLSAKGMPEPEARRYQDSVEEGRVVLTVDVPDEDTHLQERCRAILRVAGATQHADLT